MPDHADRLAHDLRDTRTGRGVRRQEMRERSNAVDEGLRRQRNLESLRLANLASRLRGGRGDLAVLKAAVEASTTRLAELDRQFVEALLASEPSAPPVGQIASGPSPPEPAEVASARSVMRARLQVGHGLLAELLPPPAARRLGAAVAAAIRRLS
jgi:hypothetical protein